MDYTQRLPSEACFATRLSINENQGIEMSDRGNNGLTDARKWGRCGIALASLGLLSLGLVACGGGSGGGISDGGGGGGTGGGETVTSTGIFVDSSVEGLRYVTNSLEGQTDAGGRFNYRAGETAQFYVGDILIGAATGALELSPIDLVPGATNENHPTVTNIARFLQTIDDDGNPSNGIRITEVVAELARGESVNFNQSISAFENDGAVQVLVSSLTSATPAGARSLIPASVAQAHLRSSLLGLLEGMWVGTVVYEAVTAPYTGDQCEWRVEGQMSDSGIFIFSNTLRRATGIGSGFCISSTGAGQWQRAGNQVEFTITTSSAYLIGNITRHAGEIQEEGRKLSVSGQGVEQGVEFKVSINASKM
jgi:hypothetical protein